LRVACSKVGPTLPWTRRILMSVMPPPWSRLLLSDLYYVPLLGNYPCCWNHLFNNIFSSCQSKPIGQRSNSTRREILSSILQDLSELNFSGICRYVLQRHLLWRMWILTRSFSRRRFSGIGSSSAANGSSWLVLRRDLAWSFLTKLMLRQEEDRGVDLRLATYSISRILKSNHRKWTF